MRYLSKHPGGSLSILSRVLGSGLTTFSGKTPIYLFVRAAIRLPLTNAGRGLSRAAMW